ncbi:hypothetical protein FOA52_003990 [Chlamydomonas sp. UWO 241]|nr:hypothetical protein FOA52_003990 [Chlamydomonas sp. UWO 241]
MSKRGKTDPASNSASISAPATSNYMVTSTTYSFASADLMQRTPDSQAACEALLRRRHPHAADAFAAQCREYPQRVARADKVAAELLAEEEAAKATAVGNRDETGKRRSGKAGPSVAGPSASASAAQPAKVIESVSEDREAEEHARELREAMEAAGKAAEEHQLAAGQQQQLQQQQRLQRTGLWEPGCDDFPGPDGFPGVPDDGDFPKLKAKWTSTVHRKGPAKAAAAAATRSFFDGVAPHQSDEDTSTARALTDSSGTTSGRGGSSGGSAIEAAGAPP